MSNRVGVLTFHRCINYGSYWQARCLVEALRARGLDAVLLDHASPRVDRLEWTCALRPVLPTPVPRADVPQYRRKIREFFRGFARLPLSRRFSLEDPSAMEPFDVVVVGSDEVWNLRHPWYGGHRLFFGGGVRAPRLVSYAASCGNDGAWDGLHPDWAAGLGGFAALAVRDGNARSLVRGAVGVEPALTLDPCLQFPLPPVEAGERPSGRFAAVYGHNFSGRFARRVRRWAHERGLPLVSIGYRNDWADEQWLAAGPHVFADVIARAEAVATNFFHGCVFALREGTPFVSEPTPYRTDKVRDLLARVGGERRLVDAGTPADRVAGLLDEPVEAEVLGRLGRLRAGGEAYLDAALA